MLPAESVSITAADGGVPSLVTVQTSKHVTRQRCSSCYTPVLATLGPSRVVVPAALFDRAALPAGWQPERHIYNDRRVIDAHDELPKFRTHFGSDLWVAESEEVADESEGEASSRTGAEDPPAGTTGVGGTSGA